MPKFNISPQDQKLQRLQQLQQGDISQDNADSQQQYRQGEVQNQQNAGMFGALKDLYGVQSQQEMQPYQQALQGAQTGQANAATANLQSETMQRPIVDAAHITDLQAQAGVRDRIASGAMRPQDYMQMALYGKIPTESLTYPGGPAKYIADQQTQAATAKAAAIAQDQAQQTGGVAPAHNDIGIPPEYANDPAFQKLQGEADTSTDSKAYQQYLQETSPKGKALDKIQRQQHPVKSLIKDLFDLYN